MRLLFVFLIGAGICALIAAAHFYNQTYMFLDQAVEVNGLVVQINRTHGGYSPVVVYTDHNGNKRNLYSDLSSSRPRFFEGEDVKVLYNPEDPRFPVNAKINSFSEIWFTPLFFFAFGSAFIIITSISWYVYSKGGVVYFPLGRSLSNHTIKANEINAGDSR